MVTTNEQATPNAQNGQPKTPQENGDEEAVPKWEKLFKKHGKIFIYLAGILLFWGFFAFVFYLFVHYDAASAHLP